MAGAGGAHSPHRRPILEFAGLGRVAADFPARFHPFPAGAIQVEVNAVKTAKATVDCSDFAIITPASERCLPGSSVKPKPSGWDMSED